MKTALPIFLLLLAAIPSGARAESAPFAEDSDLSPPALRMSGTVPRDLAPDSTQSTPASSGPLRIQVLREDHGRMTPVRELRFFVPEGGKVRSATTDAQGRAELESCPAPGARTQKLTAELKDERLSVHGASGSPYRIVVEAPCSGELAAAFKSDSNGGQALGIWQIATAGRARLAESIGLSFWRNELDFAWPADGDYYNWGTVHLTRGDHWDVVGHEMGHAIYDMGNLGQFGGGPHKIDECYSTEMALSEGWASYYSAWVSLKLDDADARFEFMVPRRAPIRFETIPDDVCNGESNEWRATGFFWDLIDLHQDGETTDATFAQVWKAMAGSKVRSSAEAMKRLERAGMDPQLLRAVWDLNFRIF